MEREAGPSAFASMHTTVPYAWRRHLAIFRVLFGAGAVLLYVILPVASSQLVAPFLIAYTLWSTYAAVTGSTWNFDFSHIQLALDAGVFLVCAQHSSESGAW